MQLAQALWYLKHDLSDEAREQGYLSCMDTLRGGGFPDETARLAEQLTNTDFRDTLSGEFAQFYAAHEQDRSLLRFHYHKLENIWQSLRDLSLPRREYSSEMAAVPELARFITEDEIDHALDRGSDVEGGKGRIYEYFTADHTGKEKAAFLKDEYGIGGHTHAVSGASGSYKDHSAKGITLKKAGCANVELSWTKVAARIDSLIQKDRFLSPREKERYAQLQREKEAERELPTQAQTDYNAIKEAHPDDIVLFQVGDFFEMYGEDAKQAAELLDLNLTTRAIPGAGRVAMCGVPAHSLERYAERGIVGGRIVDAEANRNSPFVRQVMADVERIAVQEAQAAHMDSPDRFSIRLHPNEGGITGIWDSALDRFYEEGRQVLRFAEQSNAIDYLSSIQRSRGMEPDAPVFTTPLGNAYRVGDGFSSTAAEQRDTLMVVERVDEDNVWYTLPSVPEQETVSVDRTVFERYLDTGYFFATEQTQPVKEVTAKNEQENMIFRAPYAVGDTVYLDNTPFEITEVGALNVQLRDPALRYPVFRAESREIFERLLRRDERNAAIGAYLSNVFAASDADTMTLEDGSAADFITSRSGFQAQVHGEKGVYALGLSWPDAAPVLRAVFLEEAQAQGRTQAQPEPDISHPEQPASEATEPEQPQFTTETVAFYPGEKSQLPYDIEIQTIRTTEPEPPMPQRLPAENFRILDDDLGTGGVKAKFRANMAAINLLKELEFEGAQATPEQQEILSRYVGWGGLADAFDESKDNWKDEFAELYTALSPEEYAAARASTLNAHYTSPTVIKAIYEAVGTMGFQTGNILEPAMGVGNFFGLLPQEMQGSRLYGVELDSITGRIAKQLYPKADITVAGFETTDRRDFFDLAIGNVPFGQYQVNDRAYNKLGFSIHDYFFAKTLDQVRPGGVIAFVTSRYTMDKQSPEVRKYIAQRAELLGAIRLPNNAFKANAGTEVVSDILFLQKRDRPIDIEPDWVHLGENEDGFAINQYFIDHPEMVLGTPTSESTQYGRQDYTVAPIEGADLAAQLHAAVQSIGGEYRAAELRDCVHRLIDLQMWESDDISIRAEQQKLNRLYDRFTEKYGLINSRGNALAFADDSSYYLICSLEMLDDEDKTKLKGKADMFTKRTIRQRQSVTSVDTAAEAIAQQKQQVIKEAFRDWIWRDPDRRRELVQLYNERFNSTRPREYDGRHLIFPGMNPEITLREHQLNAIAHDLYGGNTLLAHEVGAGKTFEMIAAAMEGKRLGLCQKSLFAVPNHLTEQWASEFLRLYPSANILVATKKDFETRNRKKFCARIATGDYDAVIIGHSQFERIPVSKERQERLLQEQIWEIEDGISELKASRAERFTIKELERTKKNLEAKLQKLHDAARKDDVVTFEQLGVDRLYVDEAHSFKNLFLYTKMRNVAGLSTAPTDCPCWQRGCWQSSMSCATRFRTGFTGDTFLETRKTF